jgi:hypothetical protein
MEEVQPVLADIRAEWHWVKPGIEEILQDDPDVYEIPEDVYAACVNGSAHLWITDRYFVVTKMFQDHGKKGFLLWYSWSKDRGAKYSVDAHPFFEQVARNNGCQFMQAQTSRDTLADHFINRLGYSIRTLVLAKTLQE